MKTPRTRHLRTAFNPRLCGTTEQNVALNPGALFHIPERLVR